MTYDHAATTDRARRYVAGLPVETLRQHYTDLHRAAAAGQSVPQMIAAQLLPTDSRDLADWIATSSALARALGPDFIRDDARAALMESGATPEEADAFTR